MMYISTSILFRYSFFFNGEMVPTGIQGGERRDDQPDGQLKRAQLEGHPTLNTSECNVYVHAYLITYI